MIVDDRRVVCDLRSSAIIRKTFFCAICYTCRYPVSNPAWPFHFFTSNDGSLTYSRTRSCVPLWITWMNRLFENWTRLSFRECIQFGNERINIQIKFGGFWLDYTNKGCSLYGKCSLFTKWRQETKQDRSCEPENHRPYAKMAALNYSFVHIKIALLTSFLRQKF